MKVSAKRPHLKLGSTGQRVQALEKKLKQLGHLEGKVDSTFDARTQAAVLEYKRLQGWDPRPVVGDRMARSLGIASAPQSGGGKEPTGTKTPSELKGATYNCKIGRKPAAVAKWLGDFAKAKKLDFVQLQEISGYHDALEKIPGYRLITFPKSKDHGETGVLVRDDIETKGARSLQSKIGWTNVRGGVAQPRAATSVRLAGWLRVVSVHAPPGIDWKNGQAVGPSQRIRSYGSLTEKLLGHSKRQAERNPDQGMIIGGDWNEGASTGGKWSPSWLAANGGFRKHRTGGIDWEMARGARVSDVKRGPDGGSDHHIVTFTVRRPASKQKA